MPHITYLFAVIPPLLGIVYSIMCTKARSICTANTCFSSIVCVYLTVDDIVYTHDFNIHIFPALNPNTMEGSHRVESDSSNPMEIHLSSITNDSSGPHILIPSLGPSTGPSSSLLSTTLHMDDGTVRI